MNPDRAPRVTWQALEKRRSGGFIQAPEKLMALSF
jgi:hypothetical protein